MFKYIKNLFNGDENEETKSRLSARLGSRSIPRLYSQDAEPGFERDWDFTGKFRETDAAYLARIERVLDADDAARAEADAQMAEQQRLTQIKIANAAAIGIEYPAGRIIVGQGIQL